MTILGYHRYQNWEVQKESEDNLNKEFTFGLELEVTLNDVTSDSLTPEQLATKLQQKFGDLFVYERDGSIGNGVEIISQPMTWRWFSNHIELFQDLLEICILSGFESHKGNKCGLHVHIGRQALHGIDRDGDSIQEQKVIANMQFILERFQKEIFKFSRRTTNSYNRWSPNCTELIDMNGHTFIDKDFLRTYNLYSGNRYRALNLSNEKTIEYRFLRGTLKFETFFISLNFIKNMVEQSRMSNHSVTFRQLLELGLNDKMLAYLKDYCTKRNIELESIECNTVLFLENVKAPKINTFSFLELANAVLEE